MGKGGAMRKLIIAMGLVVLLCAQSALARNSRNHKQNHRPAPRSSASYSQRGHSSLEAAFAVLAFAQMLRNGGDAACAPQCSQPTPVYYPVYVPQPVYYPAYYQVENSGPDGWE